jgi:hypothetical protein
LDTTCIYGNAFTNADESTLEKAFHKLITPQTVNLIAIEAPSYGSGFYSRGQISYIVKTAFTGFYAARILAKVARKLDDRTNNSGQTNQGASSSNPSLETVIHTGWWGCGAYGNNPQLMMSVQMLAAKWAGIDRIIFYAADENSEDVKRAQELVKEWEQLSSLKELVDKILDRGFKWSESNDT